MSTETHTAADVPADNPMDATLTELKGEKPEHDSGFGRFKPKGGADTGGKKGKPAPSAPKKKTAPTSTPKLPPKVKQAPSEAPPTKPVEAPPVPALASVPAAPPPGTTPPGSPPPVPHGFRTSFIGAFPGLSASPTPAPAPAPAATTFTGDRLGFRR